MPYLLFRAYGELGLGRKGIQGDREAVIEREHKALIPLAPVLYEGNVGRGLDRYGPPLHVWKGQTFNLVLLQKKG